MAVFNVGEAVEEQDRAKASATAEDDTGGAGLDELAIDERTAYRTKMSKWVRHSMSSIQNPVWWFVLKVSHEARAPLTFFFSALSKDGPDGLSKCVGHTRDLPIVKLMCVRLRQVRNRFSDVFANFNSWVNDATRFAESVTGRSSRSPCLSTHEKSFLRSLAWDIVQHHSSAFTRRIEQPLNQLR